MLLSIATKADYIGSLLLFIIGNPRFVKARVFLNQCMCLSLFDSQQEGAYHNQLQRGHHDEHKIG